MHLWIANHQDAGPGRRGGQSAGHRTRLRWNDEDAWVRSPGVAHEPLIIPEVFEAALRKL